MTGTKAYSGSKRPSHIPSSLWNSLGQQKQNNLLRELATQQAELEKAIDLAEKEEARLADLETGTASGSKSDSDQVRLGLAAKSPCTAYKDPQNSEIQRAVKDVCFIEFACSNESVLGNRSAKIGIEHMRLTEDVCNLATVEGLQKAIELAKEAMNRGKKIELWGSLPCKPWSRWNVFNAWKLGPKFRKRLYQMRNESLVMIEHFIQLADLVLQSKGNVSFEWPAFCVGWQIDRLKMWFQENGFSPARCDGCAFDLKSGSGNPILKPCSNHQCYYV